MTAHKNNIGALRLLLAALVIVSHAAPQMDGNENREVLVAIFGTISLGELSVAAFFLLSGYLITRSFLHRTSTAHYVLSRVLRIWPAYFACCVICWLIVTPLAGGTINATAASVLRMIFLLGPPESASQFSGLPLPVLNGSLWTIPLEFGCYLGVMALGNVGLLKPRILMALTIFALVLTVASTFESVQHFAASLGHRGVMNLVVGPPIRLAAFFLIGALGYIHHSRLQQILTTRRAALLTGCAVILLFGRHTAEAGLAVFGGAALFWLCFSAWLGPLGRINRSWDVSYGTYLYGWPIAMLILYYHRDISPFELAAIALPMALMAGAFSWVAIEKWSINLARSKGRAHETIVAPFSAPQAPD